MSTEAVLLQRLAQLERAHRRLQRGVVGLVLALAAALLLGAASEGALEAHSLKLTDGDGHVRVLLTANSGLSILDTAGVPRAVLSSDGDGPGLVLSGADSRAVLNVNQDGPALAFTGARGALRALLALLKSDPGLIFYDADEHERIALTVRQARPQVALLKTDGTPIWQVPAP